MRLGSGFWIAPNWPIGLKLEKWQWRHNFLTWHCYQIFLTLFCYSCQVYWPKFHVNIISGSGVLTTNFYKGLTRNPEFGNTTVWVLPNICKQKRTPLIKCYGMRQNSRVTAFTMSELLSENQLCCTCNLW